MVLFLGLVSLRLVLRKQHLHHPFVPIVYYNLRSHFALLRSVSLRFTLFDSNRLRLLGCLFLWSLRSCFLFVL
jgi:hypothetical protein